MLFEYSLLTDKKEVEPLTDFLMDKGAYSVSIEDADAETEREKPIFGEPGIEIDDFAWDSSRLKVLCGDDFDMEGALEAALKEQGLKKPVLEGRMEVPDNDWVRITQAQFTPTQIAGDLWIVPSWHEPPNPDAINIRLDPGVAFGTGTHPTTRLCLEWLHDHNLEGKSVLDYGCGSGILAVAAKKLGASKVLGTDIDPQAIEAADYNAEVNRADASFYLPKDMPDEKFDVVVANILSNPLRLLAPALLARVKKGGYLVLSGILERQVEELIEVYGSYRPDSPLSVWKSMDGWICLAGQIH